MYQCYHMLTLAFMCAAAGQMLQAVADLGAEHDVRWTCAHHRRHDTASLPLWFIEATPNTHFCFLNFQLFLFILSTSLSLFYYLFFYSGQIHNTSTTLGYQFPSFFRRDGTLRGYCAPGRRCAAAAGWRGAHRLIPALFFSPFSAFIVKISLVFFFFVCFGSSPPLDSYLPQLGLLFSVQPLQSAILRRNMTIKQ